MWVPYTLRYLALVNNGVVMAVVIASIMATYCIKNIR